MGHKLLAETLVARNCQCHPSDPPGPTRLTIPSPHLSAVRDAAGDGPALHCAGHLPKTTVHTALLSEAVLILPSCGAFSKLRREEQLV